MTVVVDHDSAGGPRLSTVSRTPAMAAHAAHSRPVEFRRRQVRRRRLAVTLRNLVAASEVVALSAALITITLFSLLGR
ncbi:MAG: hypothetical protein M3R48_07245 [Candidatus Dormibacteraeota bacterium]|nr:hypothetical protein [Candidatus Dormibacteraeota bacterium]